MDLLGSDHTHALGKWDIGFLEKKCSATYRGFDTFFGYYTACEAGKKTVLFSRFYITMIVLPRQARDKHRESTQKRAVAFFFRRGLT